MIIIDTSFLVSLLDVRDVLHQEAEQAWSSLENKARTIPLSVIHETYNLLQRKKLMQECLIFRKIIYDTKAIELLNRPNTEDIEITQEWFLNQKGSLSFTDISIIHCASLIKAEGIVTFDKKLEKYFKKIKK